MKLFLDDIRNPSDCVKYMHQRIGALNPIYLEGDWYIVRNYDQFVKAVTKYWKDITHISFDHDLADVHYHESMTNEQAYNEYLKDIKEKTGTDCAKFAEQFYRGRTLPTMFVHSMNPVGTQNIINVWK